MIFYKKTDTRDRVGLLLYITPRCLGNGGQSGTPVPTWVNGFRGVANNPVGVICRKRRESPANVAHFTDITEVELCYPPYRQR